MTSLRFKSEKALTSFAKQMAQKCEAAPGLVIFLQGPLGAGKTTFARGFLAGRGYDGRVKSPTYTLVEPYETPRGLVYHFDLYRLSAPADLYALGVAEYFLKGVICLVEWPECGAGVLPEPDIHIVFECEGAARVLTVRQNDRINDETVMDAALRFIVFNIRCICCAIGAPVCATFTYGKNSSFRSCA